MRIASCHRGSSEFKTWQLLVCVAVLAAASQEQTITSRPADATTAQKLLLGEFLAADTLVLGEANGTLTLGHVAGPAGALHRTQDGEWEWTSPSFAHPRNATLYGSVGRRPDSLVIDGQPYRRRILEGEDGATFTITPLYPFDELLRRAKAAQPPSEQGQFRRSDLTELKTLDTTIRYDIRYASTNNFMGEQFYSQAKAYLQRPAAQASARAHAWLQQFGYGILVHDAYRPWYVTKMFWDATPDHQKEVFVANPSKGSRHNRGCALDASLYHLETGRPADMVSGYDEFSERAFSHYPGGTSLQRWHRELLRIALEREGFRRYEWEWWHFDFDGWKEWPIGLETFEELEAGDRSKE
ncbi:MAG: M15 family metallopeptidase [Bacteroidota bacterium]